MTFKKSINRFFSINYVLMLVSLIGFAILGAQPNTTSTLFIIAAMIAYAYIYLVPASILMCSLRVVMVIFRIREKFYAKLFLYTVAVLALTLTQLIIQVDRIIFKMYGFHFNGFIWNILTTKGGVESMGFDKAAYLTSAVIFLGLVIVEILLLIVCIHWKKLKVSQVSKVPHRLNIGVPYAAVFLFAIQGLFFGFSSFKGNSGVLIASDVFPFYIPITFSSQLNDMGFESRSKTALTASQYKDLALQYPLKDIKQRPGSPEYNIVWLVAESWRYDMLNEEIMPQTWKFSSKARHFLNHYSGGNGTRKAMFSMFYGLYGNYWTNFLNEQRSPVLMDMLQQNDYQIDLYTSARFTYPEFDKTIFSQIPAKNLHEAEYSIPWQSDRGNVSHLLDFIDTRDKEKPFMTFLFFESPHARYYFPPECEIRKNYLKEFNYATVNLDKDIDLIFNRYVNSCNYLDTQFARIIDYLEDKKLLDTTIVIITGDHGEEFMEHGRWGHNSTFVDEQIKTPMVIWVPGAEHVEYTKMTSHLDIPATVMTVLGVENPAEDYSLGIDMFSDEQRQYTVLSDWGSIVYMDSDCKIVLPLKVSSVFNKTTTADDKAIKDPSDIFSQKTENLVRVLHESRKFMKKR